MLGSFDLGLLIGQLAVLAVGMGLAIAAQRRGWRPSIWATLCVALVLRLLLMALVLETDIRPMDLAVDFHAAGQNALAHRDPTLHAVRDLGWNYLPTYALFLAIPAWFEQHFGLSWFLVARIGPILFDLGVAVLVGVLAGRREGALRRFQYAVLPLPILVSAVHGQMEPACLLFAVAAFVLLRAEGPGLTTRRVVLAGALLGLAISVKTWPALFLPALLLPLPDWRRRWQALGGVFAVLLALLVTMPLTVGTPVRKLPEVLGVMLGYSPVVGSWGWSSVVMWLHPVRDLLNDPFAVTIGRIGTLLTLVAVGAVIWLWRRGRAEDLAMVSASAFQLGTAAHGVQYTSWPGPFAVARPTQWTLAWQAALGVYAAVGYLIFGVMRSQTYHDLSPFYFMASLLLLPLFVLAMPWQRRQDPSDSPAGATALVDHPASAQAPSAK